MRSDPGARLVYRWLMWRIGNTELDSRHIDVGISNSAFGVSIFIDRHHRTVICTPVHGDSIRARRDLPFVDPFQQMMQSNGHVDLLRKLADGFCARIRLEADAV